MAVALWLVVSTGCQGETSFDPPQRHDGDGGVIPLDARAPLPDGCCDVPDGGIDQDEDAGGEPDAGLVLDAGPTCEGEAERCDGDCVDVMRDVAHCGACGNTCTAPPNALPACEAGACAFVCTDGFGDCNGDATDGCEADLTVPSSCGACGTACGAYQICEAGACVDRPYGLTGRDATTTCRIGDTFPPTLDATGCYSSVASRTPASGLVEYTVNSKLWADGTGKRRFMVIPPGTTIGYTADGVWNLPIGTVLIKEFLLETRRGDPSSTIALETRFLVRRAGGWGVATYKWNATQTNADRYSGGRDTYTITEPGGGTTSYEHWFPSASECTFCHNGASGVAIGTRTIQMNRDHTYGAITDNQLRALENAGYFSAPLPAPASALPSMPNPDDATAPLAERARAYLEGNCAHCHRPGGPTERSIDLRYMTPFAMTRTCDVPPEATDFGIAGARIIAPGAPARSIVHVRVTRRGFGQMPLVGSLQVDPAGSALLRDWITSLSGCP